ncbi:MAG: type I glyceraldehyde-3-phosphate dehydrogenase [Rhodospirillaceae bacterium]|nr:type I glyceraldehyde-3-phosphate dehydrogenase [Rhodospirillaceae bacterium]
MALKVAINGFGRIGRLVYRAILESGTSEVKVACINDLGPTEANAHLLKYDTVHGILPTNVAIHGDTIDAGQGPVRVTAEQDPAKLPWKELDIDVALECTGFFANKEAASAHLKAGAKRVLISAPAKDADITVVYGVNSNELSADHTIVSNASCTTNCLAPVAHVMHREFGIERGFMTTIHSFTGDQRTVDTLHSDLHRARAASVSMIPTSTGAARAVGLVLPELNGKLDGTSIRVPTPNVSVIDFKFVPGKAASVESVNGAISAAAAGDLRGVLSTNDVHLVSSDFNHNPHSSIFDLPETQVIDGQFVRVLSWYDNEWGFSNRMVDTARAIGALL